MVSCITLTAERMEEHAAVLHGVVLSVKFLFDKGHSISFSVLNFSSARVAHSQVLLHLFWHICNFDHCNFDHCLLIYVLEHGYLVSWAGEGLALLRLERKGDRILTEAVVPQEQWFSAYGLQPLWGMNDPFTGLSKIIRKQPYLHCIW